MVLLVLDYFVVLMELLLIHQEMCLLLIFLIIWYEEYISIVLSLFHQRAIEADVQRQGRLMVAEEQCVHRHHRRTDAFHNYKPRCRLCARKLNLFGYECTGRTMKLCIGCHHNRRWFNAFMIQASSMIIKLLKVCENYCSNT